MTALDVGFTVGNRKQLEIYKTVFFVKETYALSLLES